MRILSAEVQNFASYKELHFDFTDQGLTLISGPTGAGKSTLCDVIPWILFGVTAKNGAVDEIRSWNTDEPTVGKLIFSYGSHTYYVRRIRGNKSNDLFYGFHTDYMTEGKRGKDLNDTQKQINRIIGITAETYLAGAYFHEFSQTAQFFTTSAKIRRSITEQLADLSLAKTLQENMSLYGKELKKERETLLQKVSLTKNTLEQLHKNHKNEIAKHNRWHDLHQDHIAEIADRAINFTLLKQKSVKVLEEKAADWEISLQDKVADIEAEIKELNPKPHDYYIPILAALSAQIDRLQGSKCLECGAPKDIDQLMVLNKEFYTLTKEDTVNVVKNKEVEKLRSRLRTSLEQKNPITSLIQEELDRENTYLIQSVELKKETNPHEGTILAFVSEIETTKAEIKTIENEIKDISVDQADAELLLEVVETFRSSIIERTVAHIETQTNNLLNDHYDAEIRVKFDISDSDKLEVQIMKDGNLCSYTQLSKGQRQLLKLSFGVSVMRAISNYQGVSFNCVFFDEALDGMDESIKAKSFNLLETLALEYSSVFVVDHGESFKSLFNNKIEVSLIDGGSEIEKA